MKSGYMERLELDHQKLFELADNYYNHNTIMQLNKVLNGKL